MKSKFLCIFLVLSLLLPINAMTKGIWVLEKNGPNRDNRMEGLDDWDPLVDIKVGVRVKRVRSLNAASFWKKYALIEINGERNKSQSWKMMDVSPNWTAWRDVPDDEERVDIKIEIYERMRKSCGLNVIYSLKYGNWTGDDYLGDEDGYGHFRSDKYEIWFDIFYNDYDGDGLTYWKEVLYGTDPTIDDRGKDFDNDGAPIEWEDKWGFNPFRWDDHENMDLDKDGLDNVEEWETSRWLSDPFHKDIFIEVDWMKSVLCTSHKMPDESKEMLMTAFARKNIVLHIDDGSMGGGEEIEYDYSLNFSEARNIYWNHFLHGDQNNWRRGVFHYAILCHYVAGWKRPVTGWVFNRDAFTLSIRRIKNWRLTETGGETTIASLFMHELGHTLGIFHSNSPGCDNESTMYPWRKGWWVWANYKSCMNYRYAWSLVDYSDGTHGEKDFDDWGNIDLTFFQGQK